VKLEAFLDQRPAILALAGPNGAGKSTFHQAFLSESALRFINADELARELDLDPYAAAEVAARLRRELVERRESFVFETVFSDPVGEKVAFLKRAAESGYAVVVCYIGLDSAATSDARVAMRVSQGGHDVPPEKLPPRYERSLANLERAVEQLPLVFVYDNSDLGTPYRLLAQFERAKAVWIAPRPPAWYRQRLGRAADTKR
jgi:predicted ABC-type ATPase